MELWRSWSYDYCNLIKGKFLRLLDHHWLLYDQSLAWPMALIELMLSLGLRSTVYGAHGVIAIARSTAPGAIYGAHIRAIMILDFRF